MKSNYLIFVHGLHPSSRRLLDVLLNILKFIDIVTVEAQKISL